jgi:hypothetical protein
VTNRFLLVRSLKLGAALLALSALIQRMEFSTQEERYSVSELLRDLADEIEHRNVLVQ